MAIKFSGIPQRLCIGRRLASARRAPHTKGKPIDLRTTQRVTMKLEIVKTEPFDFYGQRMGTTITVKLPKDFRAATEPLGQLTREMKLFSYKDVADLKGQKKIAVNVSYKAPLIADSGLLNEVVYISEAS